MYASKEFWERYKGYVGESIQRHKRALDMLMGSYRVNNLLDLGCGQVCEGFYLFSPRRYIGVDEYIPERHWGLDLDGRDKLIGMNYRRDLGELMGMCFDGCDVFCSIFSSEVTGSYVENLELYNRIFGMMGGVRFGLVSGFYYRGKEGEEMVREVGGLESYQVGRRLYVSKIFSEVRLEMEGPSELFGPDVVEVWRLLERR